MARGRSIGYRFFEHRLRLPLWRSPNMLVDAIAEPAVEIAKLHAVQRWSMLTRRGGSTYCYVAQG